MRIVMKASRSLASLLSISSVACLALVACASSSGSSGPDDPNDVEGDDALGGSEGQINAPPPEPEPEPEPEPVRTGPGKLKVNIKSSGRAALGKLRILTAEVDPQVIDEWTANTTYDLPAGEYDVEVTLEETLDRPTKRLRDVPVNPGETTERDVDFTVGQLTLRPTRGRRPTGKTIRWRYAGGGDWFEQTSQAGEEVVLSAGRYDAEVEIGRMKILIQDIQVYEGRRTVTTEVQMR